MFSTWSTINRFYVYLSLVRLLIVKYTAGRGREKDPMHKTPRRLLGTTIAMFKLGWKQMGFSSPMSSLEMCHGTAGRVAGIHRLRLVFFSKVFFKLFKFPSRSKYVGNSKIKCCSPKIYTPQNKHGTWTYPQNSEPFPGAMSICLGVTWNRKMHQCKHTFPWKTTKCRFQVSRWNVAGGCTDGKYLCIMF